MHKIKSNINQFVPFLDRLDKLNANVSNANIAWHIEHSLIAINNLIDALQQSNPNNYVWKFSLPRLIVFTIQKIPRGKAKSPKEAIPSDFISKQSLSAHLQKTFEKLKEAENLQANQFIQHPVFGKLNTKSTFIFLHIHTKHHLSIIKDIAKSVD